MPNQDDLKALQKVWYDKLAKDGFRDIEDGELLKEWDFNFFRMRFNLINYETKCQYYRAATHLLRNHSFADLNHKLVWELHCQGLSVRQIARELKIYQKSMVHLIIKRLAAWIKKD
jgi:hypothetical protein